MGCMIDYSELFEICFELLDFYIFWMVLAHCIQDLIMFCEGKSKTEKFFILLQKKGGKAINHLLYFERIIYHLLYIFLMDFFLLVLRI